jgi:type II secretory pathway pseudopilin PulG
MASGKSARAQSGFVYIALLIGLSIIGIGLSATAEVWTQTRQREKEEELLFIGNQIRQAISRYYLQSPPAARRFPMTLEELVEDVRTPDKPQRFLRKLYADPMTGARNWGEVRLASGQLVGVYSQSDNAPIKQMGFAKRDKDLAEKLRYSEWIFRSALPAANPVLRAGEGYSAGGASPSAGPQVPTRAPIAPPAGAIQPLPRTR